MKNKQRIQIEIEVFFFSDNKCLIANKEMNNKEKMVSKKW